MKIVETVAVLAYLAVCVAAGIWAQRKVASSAEEYWVAGRDHGTWTNSFATMAALASGGSVLGVIGLGYRLGIPYTFAMFAGAVVGFPLAAILVARGLKGLGRYTLTDFLTYRYPSRFLQALVPVVTVVALGTYLVAQMKAAGITAVYLLGVEYKTALMLTALVFILYTAFGGMRAVTVTDVLQGLLMLGSVLLVATLVVLDFGGLGSLITRATAAEPKLGSLVALPMSSYVGAFVLWAAGVSVLPHLVVRIYTARNVRIAQVSFNLAMVMYALMVFLAVLTISSAGHLLFPGTKDADTIYLLSLERYLSPFFRGLAVAGVLAAVMSTTDSLLLAASSAIVNDIYVKLFNPGASDRQVVRLATMTSWVLGLIAMVLAFNPPKLITMLYSAAVGLLVSGLFFPTILGIWWKGATTQGAITGVLVGAASYAYLLFGMKMASLSQVLWALPLSLVAMVVVSLFTAPPRQEILDSLARIHSGEEAPATTGAD